MPTETVYGLAADATTERAVAAIYAAKGRPAFNPLIAHVADVAAARARGASRPTRPPAGGGVLAGAADHRRAARRDLPGQPAGPRRARHDGAARARPPDRAGADRGGGRRSPRPRPTAPAASARPPPPMSSPTSTARSTRSSTAARRAVGVESTIVACLGGAPRLLRPGALTSERDRSGAGRGARRATRRPRADRSGPARFALRAARAIATRRAPASGGRGGARFRRRARRRRRGGAARPLAVGRSRRGRRASFRLFARARRRRRRADRRGADPERGLGAAINDRLRRAAAPREDDADGATSCRGRCAQFVILHGWLAQEHTVRGISP